MESDYASAYPDLYRRHWWWRVRERILLEKIDALIGTARGKARLLDVGCGAGLFFSELERFGYVEGIESDDVAIAQSGAWRNRIVAAQLDARFTPTEPYDLVLMLDVIEHVPDHAELLRHVARVLRPDGRILITVPAFNALWTNHDTLNHHVRRYSARLMRKTLREAGLQTVYLEYFFQSLVLPKLAVRAVEAVMRPPQTVPRVPTHLLNQLLKSWFLAEYRTARWLPFGGSLLAVAGRSPSTTRR